MVRSKIAHLSSLRVNDKTNYLYEILCDSLNIKHVIGNLKKRTEGSE
jgi:hypothetical protein